MTPNFPTSYPQAAREAEAHLGEPLEQAAWTAVRQTLSQRLSTHTFRTYVAPAHVVGSGEGLLRLGFGSPFLAEWVRDHYRSLFEEELLRVCNHPVRVEFEVAEAPVGPAPEEPRAQLVSVEPMPAPLPAPKPRASVPVEPVGAGEPPVNRRGANGLDSKYTLETFVVGASNQFAYAACKAVADGPGRTYNPLFLWGGVGLGKTHLMQAVGNKIVADRPGTSVLYTSSEQFTNDLITALQNKRMHEFRRRYREVDLLLIDDVQFLAGKPATEEEFFHTFNALHSQGKQIIVSSDQVPNELDDMEERLRSRFQWGLIADVQPPEMETRVAILKTKALQMRMMLPDDVAQFLATHIRQNVRELEGSLTRIAAFANLMKGPLTVDLCKDVLRSVLVNKGEKVDCEQIIKACADHFKVTTADIKGPVRTKHLARSRQAAMYLARRITKESFPEIGRKFGGKDHSTVINACDRVQELMAEDADFRKSVETLERELSAI